MADGTHFYVYYKHEGDWVYERTCGTRQAAKDRVEELKNGSPIQARTLYEDATYTVDELMPGAFH